MKYIEKFINWFVSWWWVPAGIVVLFESYKLAFIVWHLSGVIPFITTSVLLLINAIAFDISMRVAKIKKTDILGVAMLIIVIGVIAGGVRGAYVMDHLEEKSLDMQRVEIVNMADDKGVVIYKYLDSNETHGIYSSQEDRGDYFKVKSDFQEGKWCFIEDINKFYTGTDYNTTNKELNCYDLKQINEK